MPGGKKTTDGEKSPAKGINKVKNKTVEHRVDQISNDMMKELFNMSENKQANKLFNHIIDKITP